MLSCATSMHLLICTSLASDLPREQVPPTARQRHRGASGPWREAPGSEDLTLHAPATPEMEAKRDAFAIDWLRQLERCLGSKGSGMPTTVCGDCEGLKKIKLERRDSGGGEQLAGHGGDVLLRGLFELASQTARRSRHAGTLHGVFDSQWP